MLHFLTLLFTVFGLSAWARLFHRSAYAEQLRGAYFFLGLLSIPLLMFVGNVVLGIPLRPTSFAIFGLAVLGNAWTWFKLRGGVGQELLWHPLLIGPVFILLLLVLFHPFAFHIGHWDEYSHWLLMPKQIFYAGNVLSSTFPFPQLARYTPGHPLLVNFTNFLWEKKFSESYAIFPFFLSGLGLSASIYDFCRYRIFANKGQAVVLSWAVVLILDLLDLPLRTFEDSVLIEKLLVDVATFFFLYFLLARKLGLKDYFLLGLTVAAGLLFKRPLLILLAPFFIAWFLLVLEHPRDIWKKLFPGLLLALLPALILNHFWSMKTAGLPVDWSLDYSKYGGLWQALTSDYSQTVFVSVAKQTAFFLMKNPHLLIALFSPLWARHHRDLRVVAVSSLAFLAIYLLGLYWTYFTAFGEYEVSYLASFKRYLSVALGPAATVGILVTLSVWARKHLTNWSPSPRMVNMLKITMGVLALSVLFKASYKCFLPQSHSKAPRLLTNEFALLSEFIKRQGLAAPTVQILDQVNVSQGQLVTLRYASLTGDTKGPKKLFHLIPSLAYSENPQGVGIEKISAADLKKRWETVDIMLVFQTDPWIESQLEVIFDENCSHPWDRWIFHRKSVSPLRFSCSLKTDYLILP